MTGGPNQYAEPGVPVTFTLQETPRVRVGVTVERYGRRGYVLEVVGLDGPLTVIPRTANQVLVDSPSME